MRKHTGAVLAAVVGFVLTSAVMVPPVLSAQAERAARVAAFDKDLGPNVTRFGSDRASRLAAALRDGTYRDEMRQQIADVGDPLSEATR